MQCTPCWHSCISASPLPPYPLLFTLLLIYPLLPGSSSLLLPSPLFSPLFPICSPGQSPSASIGSVVLGDVIITGHTGTMWTTCATPHRSSSLGEGAESHIYQWMGYERGEVIQSVLTDFDSKPNYSAIPPCTTLSPQPPWSIDF